MTKGNEIDSSHVAIGKIVKAQGLRGELKAAIYSGVPNELASIHELFLGRGDNLQHYNLLRTRPTGKFAIFRVAEIADRDSAEAVIGLEMFVLKSQMPALAPDEFYWHEILGLKVITDQGQELGSVTSLIATGAHDIMVVTGVGHDEYLIPLVREIVVRQDKDAGVLVVAPTPGLLEMNSPDAI